MTGKISLNQVFAKNLRDLRRARELSQIELARMSSLSARYVGILERSEKSPTIDTVQALAEALDVEPAQLIASEVPIKKRTKAQMDRLEGIRQRLSGIIE